VEKALSLVAFQGFVMLIVNCLWYIVFGLVLARPSQNKLIWFSDAVLLFVVEWRQNIQFVYTVRNISNKICKTASKFEKRILKIGRRIVHFLSNMQNVTISRCCFVTFCKQRQRNEQRIITYAYTAMVLVAVAVKVCLIKLPKTEQTAK